MGKGKNINMSWNQRLATLNLVLILVGYQLVTSLFSGTMNPDVEGASRIVTVPYRAFALIVSLSVIILNFHNRMRLCKTQKILWFYWGLILARFFIDFNVTNKPVDSSWYTWTILYMIPMGMVPVYAVMKSTQYINIEQVVKWSYAGLVATIIISIINNPLFLQPEADERLELSAASGTLGAGYLGLTALVFALYHIFHTHKFFNRVFHVCIAVLALLVMTRSGSRGPVLCAMIVAAVYSLGYGRHMVRRVFVTSMLVSVIYLCFSLVELFISKISPILYKRLFEKEDQLGSRHFLHDYAWDCFTNNPMFGDSFGWPSGLGQYVYCHNYFLDSLMQAGIVGGITIVALTLSTYWKVITNVRCHDYLTLLGLILIAHFASLLVSGSFYGHVEISALIITIFSVKRMTVK